MLSSRLSKIILSRSSQFHQLASRSFASPSASFVSQSVETGGNMKYAREPMSIIPNRQPIRASTPLEALQAAQIKSGDKIFVHTAAVSLNSICRFLL
jgi:hypothetical protein